jgi:hypothetical protein
VRLAADLRAIGKADVSLWVLDRAWSLDPSEKIERAIFTCAIGAHCDLGQHAAAAVIEREQAARSMDDRFARAALRLYAEIAAYGRDADADARCASYAALLDKGLDELPVR